MCRASWPSYSSLIVASSCASTPAWQDRSRLSGTVVLRCGECSTGSRREKAIRLRIGHAARAKQAYRPDLVHRQPELGTSRHRRQFPCDWMQPNINGGYRTRPRGVRNGSAVRTAKFPPWGHELRSKGTSDASSQTALVCSDRSEIVRGDNTQLEPLVAGVSGLPAAIRAVLARRRQDEIRGCVLSPRRRGSRLNPLSRTLRLSKAPALIS